MAKIHQKGDEPADFRIFQDLLDDQVLMVCTNCSMKSVTLLVLARYPKDWTDPEFIEVCPLSPDHSHFRLRLVAAEIPGGS